MLEKYCKQNNVKFESLVYRGNDIEGNFQAKAREIRYQFYLEMVKKYDLEGVCLAHHKDDNIETIIMTLMDRKYVKVMQAVSLYQAIAIYRPLLNLTKSDLIEYCQSHEVPYLIDQSNFSDKYQRNRVRKFTEKLKLAHDNYYQFFDELISQYQSEQTNNQGTISLSEVKQLTRSELTKRIIQEFGNINVTEVLHRLDQYQHSKKGNLVFELAGVKYIVDYKQIRKYCESEPFNFKLEGRVELTKYIIDSKSFLGAIELEVPEGNIFARNYCPGDKIKLKNGTKKVSRIFIDKKVPNDYRNLIPIIVNADDEVLHVGDIAKSSIIYPVSGKKYLKEIQ
jgi:tRNA(Ile)-lysidine synthase